MKLLVTLLVTVLLLLAFPLPSFAQSPNTQTPQGAGERYYQATVTEIVEQGEKEIATFKNFYQKVKVTITNGPDSGKSVELEHGGLFNITPIQRLSSGDSIVLIKTTQSDGKTVYSVLDRYRLPVIYVMIALFFLLVIIASGKKGIGAIIGMILSLFIILKFIVPQILAGNDPLLISIVGSFVIMIVTIYLAHGFSRQTSVAVGATFLSLVLTGIFSYFSVKGAHLSGLGTENSYLLQFGNNAINLQGLLLGGMIIGALGVLDDITTTQAATVFELARTDKKLSFEQLITKGFRVGREHITSLVNTLVLAYAGASLAIFILFELNPANQPIWVILNSEVITEEIVRTLSGSIGLILAVPITTILAAFICTYKVKFT